MTEEAKQQIRKQAEAKIKLNLYKQPAFPYFHSMGIFELFYPVASDNEIIGFLHIWWNKDKPSGIVKGGKESKGFWETTWYDCADQKPNIEPFGPDIVDHKKVMQIVIEKEQKRMQKFALLKLQEEKIKELKAPSGVLKKYLS